MRSRNKCRKPGEGARNHLAIAVTVISLELLMV